jgi:hypothetical protein
MPGAGKEEEAENRSSLNAYIVPMGNAVIRNVPFEEERYILRGFRAKSVGCVR